MPYYISGVTADACDLVSRTPEEFRTMNAIDALTRHRVEKIDPGKKRVMVVSPDGDRSWKQYTALLISTGAQAFIPPVGGTDIPGVFALRRLADSIRIKEFLDHEHPSEAVVIGAGPIGLEMCESFRAIGLKVTLVEMAPQVMPLIDEDLAAKVQAHLESEGVECMLRTSLEGFVGDGTLERVATSAGELRAGIGLLGIGVRPVVDVAAEAGIELGARGAIRVDAFLRTNLPDIYSAGDCAVTTDILTGKEAWIPLGSTSRKQGRHVADSIFGDPKEFPGVLGTWVVKCFDLTVGRTGLDAAQAREAGFDPETVAIDAESLHDYYPGGGEMTLKLVADRGSGRLLGAQVVGRLESFAEKRLDILAVAILAGLTSRDLQYLDLAYAPPYSTALDVPIIAGNVLSGKLEGKTCRCSSLGLE